MSFKNASVHIIQSKQNHITQSTITFARSSARTGISLFDKGFVPMMGVPMSILRSQLNFTQTTKSIMFCKNFQRKKEMFFFCVE